MKRAALVLLGLLGACARLLGFQAGELDATESQAAGAAGINEPIVAGAAGEGGSGSVAARAPDEPGGAPTARCGDDELNGGEECDGDQLGDATCATAGELAGGVLRCDDDCRYDLGRCYAVEAIAVSSHVCAVLAKGKLKCWGQNDFGQLGLGDRFHRGEEGDNEMGANLPFVPLGDGRVKQVTVGARHTCVLLTSNEVRCWGDNNNEQLGVPEVASLTSAVDAPALDLGGEIERIEAGGEHTCALFTSGQVKCWGSNFLGQLGLGDVDDRGKQAGDLEQLPFVDLGVAPVTRLSAGAYHTCALGVWGMKCWGATAYAEFVPDDLVALGDQPFEMGANLPLIDLAWDSVAEVTGGGWHSCARSAEDGSVKCWGANTFGQLGYGDARPRIDSGAELDRLDLDGSVVALSAGRWHSCALLADNRVKCWGGNDSGQLGLGDAEGRGGNPDQMGVMLPAVDLGQGHTVVDVQAGDDTTCAILDRGRVKCWGYNLFGTLGLGHRRPIGAQAGEMGDALPFIEL